MQQNRALEVKRTIVRGYREVYNPNRVLDLGHKVGHKIKQGLKLFFQNSDLKRVKQRKATFIPKGPGFIIGVR